MREITFVAENGVKVYIDEEVKDWDSWVRRPYYRLRGAKITEEQALEVIRRTDTFFTWPINFEELYSDSLFSMNFNMWWFYSNHIPSKYGWVHPNGIVGINAITQKYPDINELIDEWTELTEHFPFLDLVVAITDWNEQCSERQRISDQNWSLMDKLTFEEYLKKENEMTFIDLERSELEKNIEIGVWVHDGVVEIMNKERTVQKYLEYEKLYEEPDSRIYMDEYYSTFQPDIISKEYLFKCLDAYGISDYEGFLNEHYSRSEYEDLLYKDMFNTEQ